MKASSFISFFFLITVAVSSCQMDESNGTGKLVLSVTDSPVDAVDVKAVYVTFTGLEYQNNGGAWETATTFTGPRKISISNQYNLIMGNQIKSVLGDSLCWF